MAEVAKLDVVADDELVTKLRSAYCDLEHEALNNGWVSVQHTRILATIMHEAPAALTPGAEVVVEYLKKLIVGEIEISLAQFSSLILVLAEKDRWRYLFENPAQRSVFSCALVRTLHTCKRGDVVLQHYLFKVISDMSGAVLTCSYSHRMEHACTALFGHAWWHLARDMFGDLDNSSIYEGVINNSEAAYASQVAQLKLPCSMS